jgi:hypothetical protein
METKLWDYAELSKLAKQKGGPEELVSTLVQLGIGMGKRKMIPYIVIVLIVGVGLGYAAGRLKEQRSKKKAISESELNSAKSEIINGIKNYDTLNSENHNEPNENLDNIEKEGE